jgi:hypothetical protein
MEKNGVWTLDESNSKRLAKMTWLAKFEKKDLKNTLPTH